MDPIFNEVFSLTNFAVSEFQRLLFVRNVQHTSVAFVLSFVAYNLIKFLPLWALTMIGIVLAFALPPIYIQNQAAIDAQFNKASEMGSAHFNNAKEAASKHASAASEKARLTAIDIGNKAGVDVNRYISGPGPVTSQSSLDNLAQQTKSTRSTEPASTTSTTTTTTTSFSTPIADEFSHAPSIPSNDGVHVSGTKVSESVVTTSSSLPSAQPAVPLVPMTHP